VHAVTTPARPDENQAETPLEAPPLAACAAEAPVGPATGTASGTLDQVVPGEGAWCVVQGDALRCFVRSPTAASARS
jgi:hypothetical protein